MLLKGKKALILGVANKRSIAWAIAKAIHREGAKIAFTYQGERIKESVEELTSTLEGSLTVNCDVTKDHEIVHVFNTLKKEFGHLDILIHCIAYARKEELEGHFTNTTREGFQLAQDISAYSLISLARHAVPLMEGREASITALSFIGGRRVVPNYNVMGVAKAALETSVRYLASELGPKNIRVNCISAGPINTLAARGISDFTNMLKHVSDKSPLRRPIEAEEVGDTAMFLSSHLSRGITGAIIYVDAGYHVMGI